MNKKLKDKIQLLFNKYIKEKKLNPDDFNENSNLIKDGILDSADIFSILLDLESEFKISVSEIDVEKVTSVNSLIKMIG